MLWQNTTMLQQDNTVAEFYDRTQQHLNRVVSWAKYYGRILQQNVPQQKYSENSTIDGLYNTWSYPLNDTCSPCHACKTCGKPLIQTCKTKTSTTFYSHFFKGNTKNFLNSLHLHLLVQHLEEKNPFIPSQGFNHFSFILVILALLPHKETKNEAMAAKGKLSSLLYCCESLFPSQSIP